MNTKKLSNKLSLWKNISEFPSFKELYKISNDYFGGCIKVVFLDETETLIYVCSFVFKNYKNPKEVKEVDVIIKQLFSDKSSFDIGKWDMLYESSNTFQKYNFTKNFADEYINSQAKFSKFCYLQDLYLYIMDSVN